MAYNLEGKVVFTRQITFTATRVPAWTAGSDRPIEKAARRVFGLTQALDETPDSLVSIHTRLLTRAGLSLNCPLSLRECTAHGASFGWLH